MIDAAVLALSFLLLLAVFRSLLAPLKAVTMNLLSIGAAYGVLVMVFQWGWAKDLVGIGKEGPIEAWAPMMLFAIVFGLSMDYEVFLLSRVREEYDRTGDNGLAVADGLAATARVITAAAAIMVCVFASFVLGDDRAIKIFGFGLAIAVLIDATIVRLVLMPATPEEIDAVRSRRDPLAPAVRSPDSLDAGWAIRFGRRPSAGPRRDPIGPAARSSGHRTAGRDHPIRPRGHGSRFCSFQASKSTRR